MYKYVLLWRVPSTECILIWRNVFSNLGIRVFVNTVIKPNLSGSISYAVQPKPAHKSRRCLYPLFRIKISKPSHTASKRTVRIRKLPWNTIKWPHLWPTINYMVITDILTKIVIDNNQISAYSFYEESDTYTKPEVLSSAPFTHLRLLPERV